MSRRALSVAALLTAFSAAPALAQSTTKLFKPGSLIIPQSASYQTGCGSVSAYGLVYRILLENKPGGLFGGPTGSTPVTIYWSIDPQKKSLNRCVPSNRHTAPGITPGLWTKDWNDGCDFVVGPTKHGDQPVVRVDLSLSVPSANPPLYANNTITTYDTTASNANVVPGFASVVLNNTVSPDFTTARYEGGPFLIDVSDSKRVLDFLKNDASTVDFRTACDGTTGHPYCDGLTSARAFSASVADQCHEVAIHQNLIEFTAPVYRRITTVPPHIGVLTDGPGVKGDMLPKYMASAGLDFGGAIGCPPGHSSSAGGGLASCPTGVSTSGIIYDRFVALEDLRDLTATEAANLNGGSPSSSVEYVSGALPGGILNSKEPTNHTYIYQVLWAPHWTIGDAYTGSPTNRTCDDTRQAAEQTCKNFKSAKKSDCQDIAKDVMDACKLAGSTVASTQLAATNSGKWSQISTSNQNAVLATIAANFPAPFAAIPTPLITSALGNISAFTDRPGTGLFAECASVSTFETSMQQGGSGYKWIEPGKGLAPSYAGVNRFMYTNGIKINGLSEGTTRNCTDPNYQVSDGDCIIYPLPGNAFAQIGDFQFQSASAHTIDWVPMPATQASDWADPAPQTMGVSDTSSTLRNGALILARSWTAFNGSSDKRAVDGVPSWQYETPNQKDGWTFFSLMQKDNDPKKAAILYLGGHEFSNSPAGTRVALNTLLNLGADPVFADRALAAPTAFDDANGTVGNDRALTFVSSYAAVSGILQQGAEVFNPATGSQWTYPFIKGDFRAHKLGLFANAGGNGLKNGMESDLNFSELWRASAQVPRPSDRNIFTYVGGRLTDNPVPTVCNAAGVCSSDPSAATYVSPHGVLQTGWKPVSIGPGSIVDPAGYPSSKNTGCVDVVAHANVLDLTDGTGGPSGTIKFGFKPGSDGICDLQELMQYTPLNPDSAGALATADINNLKTDLTNVKHILAIVRGNCYSTPSGTDGVDTASTAFEASPGSNFAKTNCNSGLFSTGQVKQNAADKLHGGNVGMLGGFVRSTPAIVPPSTNIPAKCSSGLCSRPTVAYAGAYDGMIHAFYVSGGSAYQGPAGTMHYPNEPATNVFSVSPNVSGGWSPPARGTELWAFMPSSQLPFIAHNAANVDASVLVQDVFADFVGSGKREWHTVLVSSAGGDSREIFALDITDPLKPVLLWDIVGSTRRTGASTPLMAAVADLADATDPAGLTSHFTVNKWDGDSITTDYKLPPATPNGRIATKAFDYSDLGGTSSLSLGLLRVGLSPVYAAFVATSSSAVVGAPTKGIAVFAIDVATGQKLWEWQREFSSADTTRPHDNYTARGVTLYYGSEGATTVLVGDYDGRVWQLDATTGVNRNYQAANCTGDCNFPAFDTGSTVSNPQPITSNIALAKLPATGVTGDFAAFSGQTMMLVGTAGASAIPSTITGKVHALLLGSSYRKPLTSCTSCVSTVNPSTTWADITAVVNDARGSGTLQEPNTWPKSLPAGERVFGYLTVAGTELFVPTVQGQVAIEDLMHIDPDTVGSTYAIDLASVSNASITGTDHIPGFDRANFGGVAVYTWPVGSSGAPSGGVSVVGAEISKLARFDAQAGGGGIGKAMKDPTLKTNAGENGVGYRLLNWFRKFGK